MWEAWSRLHPYEPDRQDLRIGILGAHLMSVLNRGTAYKPADFSPVPTEPTKPQSEAEMKAVLRPVFARINAVIGKKNKADARG